MNIRELTGNYYYKGKKVMVEVEVTEMCEYDFSYDPSYLKWEKATVKDLLTLGLIKNGDKIEMENGKECLKAFVFMILLLTFMYCGFELINLWE